MQFEPTPLAGVVCPGDPRYHSFTVRLAELLAEIRVEAEQTLERRSLAFADRERLYDRWQRTTALLGEIVDIDTGTLPYIHNFGRWLRAAYRNGYPDAFVVRLCQTPLFDYTQDLDYTLFYDDCPRTRKRRLVR